MHTGVRLAFKQDISALCSIWQSCFSDSAEYIQYFYSENFDRIEVLVFSVNGKPVSMMHLLDASFQNDNRCQAAKLIYAAGTLPEYRNKGYMSALIECATEKARENRCALFLKPSTPALTDYYKMFGFEVDAHFRLVTVYPGEQQPLSVFDLSHQEYNEMRDAAFSGIPYVKWQDDHLHWCVAENNYYSGKTIGIRWEERNYFLMGYPEKNTLIINETSLSVAQLRQLSGALCALFGTELLKAYMPETACREGEKIISSVVYNTPHRNTYVNLILI